MKLFVVVFCITVASAGKLDNTYLPPGSARTAGGSGFLAAPKHTSSFTASASIQSSSSFGPQIPILKYNNDNDGDGTYKFDFETGNGIKAQEVGQQKPGGPEGDINDVRGSFTYTGDDGVQYTITYTADENGFQAQGAHLPTPPPIPEAILKSLELNANDPNPDDGSYKGEGASSGFVAHKKPAAAFGGYKY